MRETQVHASTYMSPRIIQYIKDKKENCTVSIITDSVTAVRLGTTRHPHPLGIHIIQYTTMHFGQ